MVILATLAAALVGVLVRAALGFGFSMVFVPLTTMSLGFEAAVLIAIPLELSLGVLMALRHRRQLRLGESVLMKMFAAVGAFVAAQARPHVNARAMIFVCMFAIIAASTRELLRRNRQTQLVGSGPETWRLPLVGLTSGWLNAWSSLSGPPIVLFYLTKSTDAEEVRGALSGYFLLLYVWTFFVLVRAGEYRGFSHWPLVVLAIGCIFVSFPATRRTRLQLGAVRNISLCFMITVAVIVALRQL
jgi:uncharacterized membrane protein YfcA